MSAQIAQAVMDNWFYNGNSTSRNGPMNTQMAQAVMENRGLYNGNNTSRNVQLNTQIARAVVGNGGLYNGNNTSRNAQMSALVNSDLELRNLALAGLSGDGRFYM